MIIVNPNADYSALGLGRAFAPITPEVEAIMANYSGATDKMKGALALFFANIGETIKGKIKFAFFPIFASSKDEALYSFVQDSVIYPQSNNASGFAFDTTTKLMQTSESSSSNWQKYYFTLASLFGTGATREGTHCVMHIMPNLVANDPRYEFLGIQYGKFFPGSGQMPPASTYTKFRGVTARNVSGSAGTLVNYTDRGKEESAYPSFNNNAAVFGTYHSEISGVGSRVVIGAYNTTADEEATLRKAIIDLDNIFF